MGVDAVVDLRFRSLAARQPVVAFEASGATRGELPGRRRRLAAPPACVSTRS
jgi:hypothetical protein